MFPKLRIRSMKSKSDRFKYKKCFAETLQSLLRDDLQERKRLSNHLKVCDRTVRNWIHEKTQPSAYDLILLMKYSQLIFYMVLELILKEDDAKKIIYYIQSKE